MKTKRLFIIGLFLSLINQGFAQSVYNFRQDINTPSAAAFKKFIDYPVSLCNGGVAMNIPLYTVVDGEIQLPIVLNYNTFGIKVSDESTWVGIKWQLHVGGSITKQIMGEENVANYFKSPGDYVGSTLSSKTCHAYFANQDNNLITPLRLPRDSFVIKDVTTNDYNSRSPQFRNSWDNYLFPPLGTFKNRPHVPLIPEFKNGMKEEVEILNDNGEKMKRALITSGGGAKGAFTIGALKHLTSRGITHFDIVSGTSTGSLIAAMASIGELGLLEKVYSSVKNDDILLKQNFIKNLTDKKPFILDSEPLRELIVKYVSDSISEKIITSPTMLCLSAISLQTGILTVFSTKPIPSTNQYKTRLITNRQELIDALVASSSQAGFLPSVSIQEEQYVDGGNREVVPAQVVVDLSPDEIYVLSNNPGGIFPTSSPYTDLFKVLMRAISIFVQDVRENDLALLRNHATKTGAKLVIIEPEEDLDPEFPTGLRFNQQAMINWIRKGEVRAKKILNPTYQEEDQKTLDVPLVLNVTKIRRKKT